jgi:hypothetical protein
MLITVIVWIYIALMISVTRWPDVGAMVITFLLLGGLPLVFVIVLVVRGSKLDQIRAQQRARRDRDKEDNSV